MHTAKDIWSPLPCAYTPVILATCRRPGNSFAVQGLGAGHGNVQIFAVHATHGNAFEHGNAIAHGNAIVHGNGIAHGNAVAHGNGLRRTANLCRTAMNQSTRQRVFSRQWSLPCKFGKAHGNVGFAGQDTAVRPLPCEAARQRLCREIGRAHV